jgi:hypothetical protein
MTHHEKKKKRIHPQFKHRVVATGKPSEKPTLYIITTVKFGGTSKYFNDLVVFLDSIGHEHRFIRSLSDLETYTFGERDVLLIQQLQEGNLRYSSVLKKIAQSRARVLITIHDNFFLYDTERIGTVHHPHHDGISPESRAVLDSAQHLIFPSRYIRDYYLRFYTHPSMIVVPHIDNVHYRPLYIPPVADEAHIGILTDLSIYKGVEFYHYVFRHFDIISGIKIVYHVYNRIPGIHGNVVIHDRYDEDDVYTDTNRLHGLLYLNKWPETYCYALTKGINSGLPILYSDMGAVKERLEALDDPRYHGCDPSGLDSLRDSFFSFIRYIIENAPAGTAVTAPPSRIIPEFYTEYFSFFKS